METHHEHDCSGRHLLVLEDDDEASGDCIVSLGSVEKFLNTVRGRIDSNYNYLILYTKKNYFPLVNI